VNYGIPYQGSKQKIAKEICKIFPSEKNFYDLFGGGFAITHAMLVHRWKSFERFHFNEIRPGICDLVNECAYQKYYRK